MEDIVNREYWPKTREEAVSYIIEQLDGTFKNKLQSIPKNELINYHFSWGMGIRNGLGLWTGNEYLLAATGHDHPDDASIVIMEAIWDRLNKKYQDTTNILKFPKRPIKVLIIMANDTFRRNLTSAFCYHGLDVVSFKMSPSTFPNKLLEILNEEKFDVIIPTGIDIPVQYLTQQIEIAKKYGRGSKILVISFSEKSNFIADIPGFSDIFFYTMPSSTRELVLKISEMTGRQVPPFEDESCLLQHLRANKRSAQPLKGRLSLLVSCRLGPELKDFFEAVGFKVVWSRDYSELYKMATISNIDIALEWQWSDNDCIMRDMMRQIGKDVPIIMCRNWSEDSWRDENELKAEGYSAAIDVPFNMSDFIETCKRLTKDYISLLQEQVNANPSEDNETAQGTIEKIDRTAEVNNIDLKMLQQQFQGRLFGELILQHFKQASLQDASKAFMGTFNLLPVSAQELVEGWIDEISMQGKKEEFWRRDCGEALKYITEKAKGRLSSAGIQPTENDLFNMFQIIVLNFACTLHKMPQSRAFVQKAIGMSFIRRLFS